MPKKLIYQIENCKKVYTRGDLETLGYERYAIDQMVKKGILNKITGSVFENPNYNGPESDFYLAKALIPDGVICMLSAAVYYGLSSSWPKSIDVAVKRNKKITVHPIYPPLNIYHFSETRYELGVETINNDNNSFRIFDIEKTVVDAICFRNQIGIEETKEILTRYLSRDTRDINKLYMYAKKMHCLKTLRTYMEVLV